MQTQLVMLAILLILMCGVAAVQVWLPNLTIPTTAANLEKQDCIRSLVTRVSTVLTENNIPHFAFYGTLLGLHRGKDIILGDDDGDVCVRAEDAAKVFNAKWHHHGLRFASMNEKCKKRNVLPDHASLLRVYAKAYYVDIYLMDQDKRTGSGAFARAQTTATNTTTKTCSPSTNTLSWTAPKYRCRKTRSACSRASMAPSS